MKIAFYKYQGTVNDFVVINNRQKIFDKNDTKRIVILHDKRFGIATSTQVVKGQIS